MSDEAFKKTSDLSSASGNQAGETRSDFDGQEIKLRNRFVLLPGKNLWDLNSPSAEAFEAFEIADRSRPLYVLACDPTLPPRSHALDIMKHSRVCPVVDFELMFWPPTKDMRMLVIMEKPLGARLASSVSDPLPKLNEQQIVRMFIRPVIMVLAELEEKRVAHRGIRPNNIFWKDSNKTEMILGEAISSPPGMYQPEIMESINSLLTHPTARPQGTVGDDLFSMGAMIVGFLRGHLPRDNPEDVEFILHRMKKGAFESFTKGLPISKSMSILLGGILHDNPDERWDSKKVLEWIGGRRDMVVRPHVAERAGSRPFDFMDDEYLSLRTLGAGMVHHWGKAAEIIRNGYLENWIRRSFANERLADEFVEATNHVLFIFKDRLERDDLLITTALLFLDGKAPIRYRNMNVMVNGIGSAMAAAINNDEKMKALQDIILAGLPIIWIKRNPNMVDGAAKNLEIFEKLREYASMPSMGFGMVRCLYELNPDLPCQSPWLKNRYITNSRDLLIALDDLGGKANRPDLLADDHIIAFLATHSRKDVSERDLRNLIKAGHDQKLIAILTFLGRVQKGENVGTLPNLSAWAFEMLEPVFGQYHNRKRREEVRELTKKAVTSGKVLDVVFAADDMDARNADEKGYNAVRNEYRAIVQELEVLDFEKTNKEELAQIRGEQTAAGLSVVICVFTMIMVFYFYFA